MLGKHLGKGRFPAPDISCYNDVHGSVNDWLFYKWQRYSISTSQQGYGSESY
jgi:hypothetical protein